MQQRITLFLFLLIITLFSPLLCFSQQSVLQNLINTNSPIPPGTNYTGINGLIITNSTNFNGSTLNCVGSGGCVLIQSNAKAMRSVTLVGTGSNPTSNQSGIVMSTGVSGTIIQGVTVRQFGNMGIVGTNNTNTFISNCTISDIGTLGVSLVSNAGTTTGINFSNNTIDRSMQPAATVPQPCLIVRNFSPGINTGAIIANNTFKMPVSPTQIAAECFEIRLCTNASVHDNSFINGTIGLSAVGGSNFLNAFNNTFSGQSHEAVEIGAVTNAKVQSTITSGNIGILFDGSSSTSQDTIYNTKISGLTSFPFQANPQVSGVINNLVFHKDTVTTNTNVFYLQNGTNTILADSSQFTGNGTQYPIVLNQSPGGLTINHSTFTNFPLKLVTTVATSPITVNNIVTNCTTITPGTLAVNATANVTLGANIVFNPCVFPPVLSYSPNNYTFFIGFPIAPINITNSGGAIVGSYGISPALSSGLSFNTANGTVSGTPSALKPATLYTVSGSNAGGTGSTGLTITVIDHAPIISYSPSSQVIVINTAMTTMTPVSTGGTPTSYTISPAPPSGISFNTTTGALSGTPSVLSPATNYTITAFNSGGSYSTIVTLTVNAPAPNISYSPSTVVFPINSAITPMVPVNIGGASNNYTISPALPIGLTFDLTNGTIQGTPTALSGATTYTIVASNVTGSSTTHVTLSVINVAPNPPIPLYSPNSYTLFINTPITKITPSNSGGVAVSYSIDTPLPTGLSFSTVDGSIQGTPTVLSGSHTFSVTAFNSGGNNSTPITIQVIDQAPNITFSPSTVILPINQIMTPMIPISTGGSPTSYTITGTLPPGLNFSTVSGRISGLPTAASPPTNYTVTAINGTGSSPTTVNISVVLPTPPSFSYSPSTIALQINIPSPVLTPISTGGFITSYSISPALPSNLIFNTVTGQISGVPNVLSSGRVYTITGINLGGVGHATLTLSVTPPNPPPVYTILNHKIVLVFP